MKIRKLFNNPTKPISENYPLDKGPLKFPDRFANAISKIYSGELPKRKYAVTCRGRILNPGEPKPRDITDRQGRVLASSRGLVVGL